MLLAAAALSAACDVRFHIFFAMVCTKHKASPSGYMLSVRCVLSACAHNCAYLSRTLTLRRFRNIVLAQMSCCLPPQGRRPFASHIFVLLCLCALRSWAHTSILLATYILSIISHSVLDGIRSNTKHTRTHTRTWCASSHTNTKLARTQNCIVCVCFVRRVRRVCRISCSERHKTKGKRACAVVRTALRLVLLQPKNLPPAPRDRHAREFCARGRVPFEYAMCVTGFVCLIRI